MVQNLRNLITMYSNYRFDNSFHLVQLHGVLFRDDDVSVVENELEAELLNESLNKTKFHKEEVDLLLPSFKIEADLQLKEILQSVGRILQSIFRNPDPIEYMYDPPEYI